MTPNELILAGDPELRDVYVCSVIRPPDHMAANPLVRVIRIIRYPIQHAILLPDVPNENPPIPEGTVCRLTAIGPAPPEETEGSPAEALRNAQEEYLRNCPPEEAGIVRRHMAGEYGKRRVVFSK